jgi:putative component of membrane protein insertase Oxa1/YidC/SpoIIIJ protein YidD
MKKNNFLITFSIFAIKKMWHGNFGKNFNKKRNILCRFYPSCSDYAIMALEKHGFFKGWLMAYNRFKRCTNENTETCIDYP